jgi:hypothetical protein
VRRLQARLGGGGAGPGAPLAAPLRRPLRLLLLLLLLLPPPPPLQAFPQALSPTHCYPLTAAPPAPAADPTQAIAGRHAVRVTFLSGDVHVGAFGCLQAHPKVPDRVVDPKFMLQVRAGGSRLLGREPGLVSRRWVGQRLL